jgi:hypothetical protein
LSRNIRLFLNVFVKNHVLLTRRKLFSFFMIVIHLSQLKFFMTFLYNRDFKTWLKLITFFMQLIISRFNESEKSKRYRNSKCFFNALRVDEIEESDSMFNVAMLNEKNDVFKMIFYVDMKIIMIERFFWIDLTTCLFVRNSIASKICFFVDSSVFDLIVFFLIHVMNETR